MFGRGKASQTGPIDPTTEAVRIILGETQRGGARFRNVVLTRNRRVMASVADGGRTLRLHEAFAHAPPEVLHSLGRIFSSGDREERSVARDLVRSFLAAAIPARSAPAARRLTRHRPHPSDAPHLAELLNEFRRVNGAYFGGSLPEIPIRLSGRMRRRNGHFSSDPLEIAISRTLCARGAAGEAFSTLRHEMIHLWQWTKDVRVGHGADFRGWARLLGVHPRASRTVCWTGTSESES